MTIVGTPVAISGPFSETEKLKTIKKIRICVTHLETLRSSFKWKEVGNSVTISATDNTKGIVCSGK
uniref:Uncharacterized protein n=1 Tax=Romanomermis culicivorax TaxID=13658 RepID=A0A915JGF3_ROMCU